MAPRGPYKRRPDRATVFRIIGEEAARLGAPEVAVINCGQTAAVIAARRSAICRIIRETGCSSVGLAEVWGCDRATIKSAALHGQSVNP